MRQNGKIWAVLVGVIVLVLIVGIAVFGWYRANYDKAIALEENARTAWANVDAVLQRRMDLIPNLVDTVKGYASHERELFENIAQARTKYFQANTINQQVEASNQLSGLLSRLLMLQEAYPDLKANQNFLDLQAALEGTENRISVARTRYNQAVQQLNSYARSFFGSFFTRRAGVEQMEYFQASEQAQTEVPDVNF